MDGLPTFTLELELTPGTAAHLELIARNLIEDLQRDATRLDAGAAAGDCSTCAWAFPVSLHDQVDADAAIGLADAICSIMLDFVIDEAAWAPESEGEALAARAILLDALSDFGELMQMNVTDLCGLETMLEDLRCLDTLWFSRFAHLSCSVDPTADIDLDLEMIL